MVRIALVFLFCLTLLSGCSPPAAPPTKKDLPPVRWQADPGADIGLGLDEPAKSVKTKAPALTRADQLPRMIFEGFDEIRLRKQLVELGADQVKNPNEPEWYIRKGMVAEELTRFDAVRKTDHWNRAMVHYSEAIEILEDAFNEEPTEALKKRIAEVKYYRSRCEKKLGKDAEAKEDREAALAHPNVAAAIAEYEKQ